MVPPQEVIHGEASRSDRRSRLMLSPGLEEAPVLDRMCSQFVLTLTMRNAGALQPAARLEQPAVAGRQAPGVAGARCWRACATSSTPRCKGNEQWRGHELLSDDAFMRAPRRLARAVRRRHAVLLHRRVHQGRAQGPARRARRHRRLAGAQPEEGIDAGREEHRRARRPAAAQPGRARAAAVRHAGALSARPARPAGRVQGQQRAGGLCGDRRAWPASTRPTWPRRCAPARGWSASAWSRT